MRWILLSLMSSALLTPTSASAETACCRLPNIRVNQTPSRTVPVVQATLESSPVIANVTADLTVDGTTSSVGMLPNGFLRSGSAALAVDPPALAEWALLTVTAYASDGTIVQRCTGERYPDALVDFVCSYRSTVAEGEAPRRYDIALGRTALYPVSGARGATLALDFTGADADLVDRATVDVSEEVPVGDPVCQRFDEANRCVSWTTPTETVTRRANVSLGMPFAFWEVPQSFGAGERIFAEIKVRDARERLLVKSSAHLSMPHAQLDEAADSPVSLQTVPALGATNMTLALHSWPFPETGPVITVTANHCPLCANSKFYLELDTEFRSAPGGGRPTANTNTLELPVTSLQRAAVVPIAFTGDPSSERFKIIIDGAPVGLGRAIGGGRGLCTFGACFALSADDEGQWWLSVTVFDRERAALPDEVTVRLEGAAAVRTTEASYRVDFRQAPETFIASRAVEFTGDPRYAFLEGRLGVQREVGPRITSKIKVNALARFSGRVSPDPVHAVALAATSPVKGETSKGDILIGGEPIDIELELAPDGLPAVPPVVQLRNGTGTRAVHPNMSQTQQTHLL